MKDMYELPLDRYRLFDSQDVDETRARVANVFCDHQLDLIGRGARMDSRMNCVRIQHVALASITYGGDVRVDPGECESFFPVMALLSGRGTFRSGKEVLHAVPGLVPVASPTLSLSMMLAGDTKLAIARIERSALEAMLSDMLDRSLPRPLEFSLTMDTSTRWGHGWYQAFSLCAAELDAHDSSWSRSLAARRLERWLMEGLLLAQPSNYSALLNGATPPVPNRAVNIAIELMHAHPEADHSISSLARAAGVSVRALQEGFKRHAQMPPLAYLRRVRLEHAHDALRAAQPGSTTVSEVAAYWGFPHLGRFAGWYRRKYGETPSQTLYQDGPAPRG